MEISYSTHAGGMDLGQGYGVAGQQIIKALQELGHTTPFQSADSPVTFQFTQPYYFTFNQDQYNIGYTPWESTKLMDGWVDAMNQMDEMWTTSDWCANVFEDEGVRVPIKIYEHGIDPIWEPYRRRQDICDGVQFLHVGEPAPRKCGQMALDAFVETVGGREYQSHSTINTGLTIKCNGYSTVRAQNPDGTIANPAEVYTDVDVEKSVVDITDLVYMYSRHQVLIYPSYGEGFGFIPLQAMASGMPTILNTTWAPYRRFSIGLEIEDKVVPSPWPNNHPGNMLQPSFESLKENMITVFENYDHFADRAYENALKIHEEYNWKKLTEDAFEHVVKMFGND